MFPSSKWNFINERFPRTFYWRVFWKSEAVASYVLHPTNWRLRQSKQLTKCVQQNSRLIHGISINVNFLKILDKGFWVIIENSNSKHSSSFCVICAFKRNIYCTMCPKLIWPQISLCPYSEGISALKNTFCERLYCIFSSKEFIFCSECNSLELSVPNFSSYFYVNFMHLSCFIKYFK